MVIPIKKIDWNKINTFFWSIAILFKKLFFYLENVYLKFKNIAQQVGHHALAL